MKRYLFAAAALTAMISGPALAADVGVSINVGEPGFYGRIDLGDVSPPQLIYRRPVVIERVPGGSARQPIYLHVPPGHEKNWREHCHQYNACGQPVYFVRDKWYRDVYVTHYREQNRGAREQDDHRGGQRDEGHDRNHDDRDH
jgi:hypothetical protein